MRARSIIVNEDDKHKFLVVQRNSSQILKEAFEVHSMESSNREGWLQKHKTIGYHMRYFVLNDYNLLWFNEPLVQF